MGLRIVGNAPFSAGEAGRRPSRIATLFPSTATIITLPGIHATQRLAYVDLLNKERAESGPSKLTREEEDAEMAGAVDLIMEDDAILIRPRPDNMPLAFQADELLQELVSKQNVKFLDVRIEQVHHAIKQRGECWRVTPLPKSPQDMQEMIAASRIAIHGDEIYYYNKAAGTRFLTCREFDQLAKLDDAHLRLHLAEIGEFSARTNIRGKPEVDFFMADDSFSPADFAPYDFQSIANDELRAAHGQIGEKLQNAVPAQFQKDDPANLEWRNAMCTALIGQEDEVVSEETLLGLSSEFFMQIQWLPGGRIEQGELIFDPIFEETGPAARDPETEQLYDEKARGFIYNFVREYGDLEYVNIGRVIGSLSQRPPTRGRREVYIAQVKQRGSQREILSIIRMQKWGVWEHLDEGTDRLTAILDSEEYTEYVLDRRLGCRQLGMNLPIRVTAKKIGETYAGRRGEWHGTLVRSPYFEREYIPGIATDKIPNRCFQSEAFALGCARLLGRAAASNVIVGRCAPNGKVLFDDGDEVVVETKSGLPTEIVVADQTGTFSDYHRDLLEVAVQYAQPIARRWRHVANPHQFAGTYVDAFRERFARIQEEYRNRRGAFDTLFKHRVRDEAGSFAYRWERVLERLDRTDPHELAEGVRNHLTGP
ncbi:MAG: hypothetical protein HQ582_26735 [Planctomycetes bacterium]|nr:hypothetical protein [Planctomycetota bacterium]